MLVTDEFNFYAVSLIFGRKNPRIKLCDSYSFDIFRKHKGVKFSEFSGLSIQSRLEIRRHLHLTDDILFEATHVDSGSGIAKILTCLHSSPAIHMSDAVFSDEEFERFARDWFEIATQKVKCMAILLRSVKDREIIDLPLLVNQFPNITKTLLEHPNFWRREKK